MFKNHNFHEGEADNLEQAHEMAYGEQTLMELYESGDLVIVNCCDCGKECLPMRMAIRKAAEVRLGLLPESLFGVIAGKIKGDRPICSKCIRVLR